MPRKKDNRGAKYKDPKENFDKYRHYIDIYEYAKVFGLAEINSEKNIRDGIKPNTPLPYYRTAYELGQNSKKLIQITESKQMKEYREEVKEDLFKKMQKNSEKILNKTFDLENGGFDMKDSERARLALDFKKSTDKKYNPTQSIDLSVSELDFSNLEDLKAQLSEELGLVTNNKDNDGEE